ncbi:ABSCISIC ACID-INSENSITIVE 5-like protein 2 [Aristolochia californica]|uniref:ABSCISIC ACID-INSENSITIVE 5-like protein 2 n=1 Tax=Aristolochia californica TaxID=171875 RepID=UPI0035D8D53C
MGSQGGGQQSQFQSLARQSSLYSLTLDEVQNQLGDLGKPLSSMNLDELLKNVWTAESNQAGGLDIESASIGGPIVTNPGLQRQSSVTLNQTLSKKTVDEVWRDIQQGQSKNKGQRKVQEMQPTLGEMTLEDFLVKAGVVAEGSEQKQRCEGELKGLDLSQGVCSISPAAPVDTLSGSQNYSQQAPWLQYHYQQQAQPQQQSLINTYMPGRPVPQQLSISQNPLMDVSYPENQMSISPPLMGTLSDTQTPGRKRVAPGGMGEKTVERRQKRMIKNRESAARSRARKQAYTNELENKVSRLEEENERLKKQKELERILHCAPPPEPKYQLRRTSSAPF